MDQGCVNLKPTECLSKTPHGAINMLNIYFVSLRKSTRPFDVCLLNRHKNPKYAPVLKNRQVNYKKSTFTKCTLYRYLNV